MEKPSETDDSKQYCEFLKWYTDLIENHTNIFVHYLSKNAVLYWFGRTVKGPEKILTFIKNGIQGTKHKLTEPKKTDKFERPSLPLRKMTLAQIYNQADKLKPSAKCATPESTIEDLNVPFDYLACGDGPNINGFKHVRPLHLEIIDDSRTDTNYLEVTGGIQFTKPNYRKPGVAETRWERPCTLKIAYKGYVVNPADICIELIIYNDNMTCKRNLLPEFEKCLIED